METVLKAIADWIKGILTAGIMSNLSGLFDDVNTQVGNIAQQVGTKPSSFEPRVFAMIEALSRNVVLPIAGIILTFIACYELIEMITQHNNMAQFEPALIMRWIFKTAISVWLISNTFDIVMAVFDVTQKVVSDSSSIIAGNTRVNDIGLSMLQSSLMQMDVGPLGSPPRVRGKADPDRTHAGVSHQLHGTVGHTGAGAEQQHRNARRRDLNDSLFIRYGNRTVLTAQRAVFQVQKGHPVPDLRQRLQIRADHARHIIHGCFLRAGWSSGQGRRLCRGQCPDTASPGTLPGRSPAGCPHRSPPAT